MVVLCMLKEQLIVDQVGSGVQAEVLVCRHVFDPLLGEQDVNFAVKLPRADHKDEVWHEATMLTLCEKINHMRVPFVAGLVRDEQKDTIGIAIHRIKGLTLRDFATATHEPAVHVGILHHLAQTIVTLHRHHIYHNDPKNDNVIIARDHMPYLIDFGIASEVPEPDNKYQKPKDTVCFLDHIELLFPQLLQQLHPVQRKRLPPCIVAAHESLTRFVDGKATYDVQQLLDLFAHCTCTHHQYRDQPYFRAPHIAAADKRDWTKMAQLMTAPLQCETCNNVPTGAGGPMILDAPQPNQSVLLSSDEAAKEQRAVHRGWQGAQPGSDGQGQR